MSIGLCRFKDLADIRLGVKTFLNPFFYVDRERVQRFGIEERFLEPVFRTRDVERDRFIQDASETELQIFLCNQDIKDLTGTGAAAYITWGSKQRHRSKAGNPGGLWSETPAVKPETRFWYRNQAMPPPARIVLLKAFDDYFAPMILDRPVRVDQRFNQVLPQSGVDEMLLIGLLASAWFVMTVETRGRTAMGQGVLEVPTNTLRDLEVPDIRNLDPPQKKAWVSATEDLLRGKRLPASKLAAHPAQRALDAVLLASLGVDGSRIDELYSDTGRMRNVRKLLAKGRGAIKRERFEADLAGVARDIAGEVAPLLQQRRFPEDFVEGNVSTQSIQLGNAPILLEAERMLGQHHILVRVGGEAIFDADLQDPIGEVFIRSVQMGRRNFQLPLDGESAGRALLDFDRMVAEVDGKLQERVGEVAGSNAGVLLELAERELNFPVIRVKQPIPTFLREDH
jgi:hypothetical protein